jgi:hypothetical protein
MLEHSSLWLSAPTLVWPSGLPRAGQYLRWVLAGETREPAGHLAVTTAPWWRWPRGSRIAAYESPDCSLLFSARRVGWLRHRIVIADADGQLAALVRGPYVVDRRNRFVAYEARPGVFIGPSGVEVARCRADGLASSIEFGDAVRDEPFAKMGLLAASLMER